MEETVLENMLRREDTAAAEGCTPIMVPVRYENQFLGLAYFGKPKFHGAWRQKEREIVDFLAKMIGLSLAARIVQNELEHQNWVFNEVMDKLNINLYVTEPQTGRILFMNETMKRTYGLEHPEGELCWRVLQNSADCRCAQCMVPKLLEENGANTYCWEKASTINGRIYQNTDSLMRWINGSVVHVQQSVDITEFRRLYSEASVDDLTGLLNRRAGKAALEQAVVKSREQGQTLTVGMIDVNELKQINDLYGHRQGDALLKMVASTIQNALRSDDLFFRLSGDEFIVVFSQCGLQESNHRMQRISERLEQNRRAAEAPYEAGFCYGLEEVGPEDSRSQTDILSQADERMYEQKRRHHILAAEQRLCTVSSNAAQKEIEFDYDKDKLYDALVQSTDDYIYLCNMKTGVFRYPQAMVEEFDLPSQVIENAAAVWGDHVHFHDKAAFLEANQEIIDGRTNCHCVEYRALNRRGEWVWLRCRGHLERDENGDPCLFAGIITNLGQRNKIDHMTGLLNKFEFEKEIQSLTAGKPQVRISIVKLGLDGFKHINDLYDRDFGDEVLRITAQKIQSLLPSNGMVYRLDGDEFGVILRGAQKQDVETFYQSLKELFKQQREYAGSKYYCTLSAGCASYPKDGTEYLDLFKYADYSLEYAKEQGRDRLAFFSQDILLHHTRLLDITELMRESVENDFAGFELVFQPQVVAATGALTGAEALVRWRCDKYGPISPVEFIPLLEQSGLILPIGRWIFQQAVAACALWKIKPRTLP